jgi:hypothetical protein
VNRFDVIVTAAGIAERGDRSRSLEANPAFFKMLFRPNHNWSQVKSVISLAAGFASVRDPSWLLPKKWIRSYRACHP